ncbi:MAG: hypothetical protein ACYC65_13755 [Candidatus Limnocylindrales bacterium]
MLGRRMSSPLTPPGPSPQSLPADAEADEGLPRTLERAYGQWCEKRSALTEVTEEV